MAPASNPRVYQTPEALHERLADRRVVLVEGARCTGKDRLIQQLVDLDPTWRVHEILYPRKQFAGPDGSVKQVPGKLEMQQATYWVLDFLRQQPDLRVILNRGAISSFHFDGVQGEGRLEFLVELIQQCEGLIVMVEPDYDLHRRFIATEGRYREFDGILLERRGMNTIAHELPRDMVVWYSPANVQLRV